VGSHSPRPARPLVVQRKHGKACSRRALCARADSRGRRRGRPVLQEPVLAAADGECRNRPGFPGVLLEIPETSISTAARNAPQPAPLAHRRGAASGIDSIIQHGVRPRSLPSTPWWTRHTRSGARPRRMRMARRRRSGQSGRESTRSNTGRFWTMRRCR
jgi:hypothetical protein